MKMYFCDIAIYEKLYIVTPLFYTNKKYFFSKNHANA